MIQARRAIHPFSAVLLAALLLGAGASPRTVEGRWILVEQTYGKGSANLASPEQPVRLEFFQQGDQRAARVWLGDDESRKWIWPAWIAEGRLLPAQVIARTEDPSGESVHVRYRVQPSASGDMVLEVEESYRLAENGSALVGTVKATFRIGDETRGAYELHRRFKRLP